MSQIQQGKCGVKAPPKEAAGCIGTCQQLASACNHLAPTTGDTMIHSLVGEAVYFNATMPLDLDSAESSMVLICLDGPMWWASQAEEGQDRLLFL